jgi:hypothetical protein
MAVSWHSRWMSTRCSVRRLLTAALLSQAMVIQALLLSWGGALAVTGEFTGGLGVICSDASKSRGSGGTEPRGKPDAHGDCLSACLTSHAAAKLPDHASLFAQSAVYARVSIPAETPLLERSGLQAFLARAPPLLT